MNKAVRFQPQVCGFACQLCYCQAHCHYSSAVLSQLAAASGSALRQIMSLSVQKTLQPNRQNEILQTVNVVFRVFLFIAFSEMQGFSSKLFK